MEYERIFETVKTFHPRCFAFVKGSGGGGVVAQTQARKCCSEMMRTEGGQTAGRRSNTVFVSFLIGC